MQKWNSMYVDRRLVPWEKFFYLQIHLASPEKLNENLFRTVGASLTLSSGGETLPGYQVALPGPDAASWRENLKYLDPVFSRSYLPIQRLSDVADLQEVFAVFRMPYSPPDEGFPGMSFITSRIP